MTTNDRIIKTVRTADQDASQLAAQAAREAGTTLAGNLRWHGGLSPAFRGCATADGREVRVYEPEHADSI